MESLRCKNSFIEIYFTVLILSRTVLDLFLIIIEDSFRSLSENARKLLVKSLIHFNENSSGKA